MNRSASWYACAEPERPTDPYVEWHLSECSGCAAKAAAVLAQGRAAGDLTDVEDRILARLAHLDAT